MQYASRQEIYDFLGIPSDTPISSNDLKGAVIEYATDNGLINDYGITKQIKLNDVLKKLFPKKFDKVVTFSNINRYLAWNFEWNNYYKDEDNYDEYLALTFNPKEHEGEEREDDESIKNYEEKIKTLVAKVNSYSDKISMLENKLNEAESDSSTLRIKLTEAETYKPIAIDLNNRLYDKQDSINKFCGIVEEKNKEIANMKQIISSYADSLGKLLVENLEYKEKMEKVKNIMNS